MARQQKRSKSRSAFGKIVQAAVGGKSDSKNAEHRWYDRVQELGLEGYLYEDKGNLGFSYGRLNSTGNFRRTISQHQVDRLVAGVLGGTCDRWSKDQARIPNAEQRRIWAIWARRLRALPAEIEKELHQPLSQKYANGQDSSVDSDATIQPRSEQS